MNRSLTAILTIGVVGFAAFAVAGYMLADAAPTLHVRVALERELPVVVKKIATVADPATRARVLEISVEPRGATPSADLAPEVAMRACAALAAKPSKLDYDAIRVTSPDGPTLTFERRDLERHVLLESKLADVEAALARAFGSSPGARLVERGRVVGIALAARPPGSERSAVEIAAPVFTVTPLFSFVELPGGAAGDPPILVRRDGKTSRPE